MPKKYSKGGQFDLSIYKKLKTSKNFFEVTKFPKSVPKKNEKGYPLDKKGFLDRNVK